MHVRMQTCSGHDYEVIVIDDNSPDGTLEVAKQLQDLYGEERIVRLPNLYIINTCCSTLTQVVVLYVDS